jgi:hypothetical protein
VPAIAVFVVIVVIVPGRVLPCMPALPAALVALRPALLGPAPAAVIGAAVSDGSAAAPLLASSAPEQAAQQIAIPDNKISGRKLMRQSDCSRRAGLSEMSRSTYVTFFSAALAVRGQASPADGTWLVQRTIARCRASDRV